MRPLIISLAFTLLAPPLAAQFQPPSSVPPPSASQSHRSAPWGGINALGYSGVGVAIAWVTASGTLDDALGMSLMGAVLGLATGGAIGHTASSRVNAGRPVTPAHQVAVAIGTVGAGAAFGALAAVPLIGNDASTTVLGSDERTLGITIGAGAALGALYFALRKKQFATAVPSVVSTRDGMGLGLRFDFR